MSNRYQAVISTLLTPALVQMVLMSYLISFVLVPLPTLAVRILAKKPLNFAKADLLFSLLPLFIVILVYVLRIPDGLVDPGLYVDLILVGFSSGAILTTLKIISVERRDALLPRLLVIDLAWAVIITMAMPRIP